MSKSKMMMLIFSVAAVLLVLLVVGKKSAHAEITISSSADSVWSVLSDAERIVDWNSVLVPVNGEIVEGSTVKYEFYQDEGGNAALMDARVKEMIPGKLLNQKGGMPGILTFDHRYILEEEDGVTRVTIHEDYRGIMVPFWNPSPVEEAYERLLNQLREEVEEQ